MVASVASSMVAAAAWVLLCCSNGLMPIAAAASSSNTSNLINGACVTNFNASHDYFPDKATPKYAELFTVEYFNYYKLLTVTVSTGKVETYALWQCGTMSPNLTDMNITRYIEVPVTKVAMDDTTIVPRLAQCNERESMVAFTSNQSFISAPCTLALFGDDESSTSSAPTAAPSFAPLLSATPTSAPVTSSSSSSADDPIAVQAAYHDRDCGLYGGDRINNTLLEALGVQVHFSAYASDTDSCNDTLTEPIYKLVSMPDIGETGNNENLKLAEWVKAYSLFYNQEARANDVYDGIEQRWNCTTTNAQYCSGQRQQVQSVAWFGYYEYASTAGGGWSLAYNGTYYDEAITAAGGEMITCTSSFSSSSFGEYLDDADFIDCYGEADACIFNGVWDELYGNGIQTEILNQLNCVQQNQVYDIAGRGVNDWFEAKIGNPDVLLEDMVMAIHSDVDVYGIGPHDRVWLRHVMTNTTGGGYYAGEAQEELPSYCNDTSAEWVSDADECELVFDSCDI